MSWQKFACLLSISIPSEGLTPFECCSQTRSFHLPIAFQQRSNVVGLGEFLPCLGSWPWHFRWCQRVQPQGWWSCQSRSSQRFAYLLSISRPSGELIPFGCCSQTKSFHPQAACQRRSTFVGQEGFLPCLGSWPSHFQWYQRVRPQGWWSYQSKFSQRSALS